MVEEGQVVADARLEELHVLRHHADPAAQLAEPDGAQVGPAERDGAGGRIVEAEEQPREGRLAAAGAPEQAQHLPCSRRSEIALRTLSLVRASDRRRHPRPRHLRVGLWTVRGVAWKSSAPAASS